MTRQNDWKILAEKVRTRDKYTCQRCGNKASDIHHIVPRAISKNDNQENLICLCSSCHRKTENDLNRGVNHNLMIKLLDTAYERSLCLK